jgi:hypothetical protein
MAQQNFYSRSKRIWSKVFILFMSVLDELFYYHVMQINQSLVHHMHCICIIKIRNGRMYAHVNCQLIDDVHLHPWVHIRALQRACTTSTTTSSTTERARIKRRVAQVEHRSTNMSVTCPQSILCETGNGNGNYLLVFKIKKNLRRLFEFSSCMQKID